MKVKVLEVDQTQYQKWYWRDTIKRNRRYAKLKRLIVEVVEVGRLVHAPRGV